MGSPRKYLVVEGGGLTDEDAVVIGSFLDRKFRNIPFTSGDVVDAARDGTSPIHDYFEWDDPAAAEAHRRSQAAHLVRHILVVEKRGERDLETRGFHYLTVGSGSERAFVSERVVWKDQALSSQVVEMALRELRSWKRRYEMYEELAATAVAVGSVIAELEAA
jgi:hypothetical protein